MSTPLAPGACLIKVTQSNHGQMDLKLYQGMVGLIMYDMLCACPDLASLIQQRSQFNSNPEEVHFQTGKQAIRYLQRTQTDSPIYNGEITVPNQA